MPKGRILVIRGGAIGDFILTLPVLQALRSQFPETELELLGYQRIAKLAESAQLVSGFKSLESQGMAMFFARQVNLPAEFTKYFARFAVIVSFLYDPDEIFKNNVQSCTSAQFIAGPHRPNETERTHATEVFLKPLQQLAIFDADPTPRITLPAPAQATNTIALHPGSGSEKKNWPESKWGELIQKLINETEAALLLVGGEAEGDRLERLTKGVGGSRVDVARNLPLPDLAEKLTTCRAFLGHDSGISHLAAAVGLPGVALWGESVEEIWRPRSERFVVVRDPKGLPSLNVETVFSAAQKLLA